MSENRWVVTARGLLALCVVSASSQVAWRLAGGPVRAAHQAVAQHGADGVAGLSFSSAIVVVCSAAFLLCWAWLVLTSMLLIAQTMTHVWRSPPSGPAVPDPDTLAGRLSPRLVRKVVLTVCGVAVTSGLAAAPALADPSGHDQPTASAAGADLTGLALPDRTTGAEVTGPVGSPHDSDTSVSVVVVPGDSLWSIAERWLPPDATDHEVTIAWHALHRANVDVIGSDPDRIFPGTTLELPSSVQTSSVQTDRKDTP